MVYVMQLTCVQELLAREKVALPYEQAMSQRGNITLSADPPDGKKNTLGQILYVRDSESEHDSDEDPDDDLDI